MSGQGPINSRSGHRPNQVTTGKTYHPAHISRIGSSMGNHATETARRLTNSVPETADRVSNYGANTSPKATVYGSGTQQGPMSSRDNGGGRDILSEFGPESNRR